MPDDDEIIITYIAPVDLSWIPPAARSLEEAYRMGAQPPRMMTREEFERKYQCQ